MKKIVEKIENFIQPTFKVQAFFVIRFEYQNVPINGKLFDFSLNKISIEYDFNTTVGGVFLEFKLVCRLFISP